MSDLKEISFDKQDLIELKLTLDTFDGGSHFVIQRATNDALTGVRTTSVNEISGKVTLT